MFDAVNSRKLYENHHNNISIRTPSIIIIINMETSALPALDFNRIAFLYQLQNHASFHGLFYVWIITLFKPWFCNFKTNTILQDVCGSKLRFDLFICIIFMKDFHCGLNDSFYYRTLIHTFMKGCLSSHTKYIFASNRIQSEFISLRKILVL